MELNCGMPGRTEEKVRLICVKLKSSDSPEKVKSKVLKSLRNAEKHVSQARSLGHPLGASTMFEETCTIAELNAESVSQVVTNSKYIVFLLKDGSVCRLKCTSRESTLSKFTTSAFQRSNQPKASFQVLSDAEYARQLQAQFDSEGGGGMGTGRWAGRGGRAGHGATTEDALGSTSGISLANFNELDRRSRELMFLGSVPSPEFNSDPEYYRNLARNLSYCDIRIEEVGHGSPPPSDFYTTPLTPPPTYEPLSLGTLRLVAV